MPKDSLVMRSRMESNYKIRLASGYGIYSKFGKGFKLSNRLASWIENFII